jgi:transcriptional regulator with XRE-family HTH domain
VPAAAQPAVYRQMSGPLHDPPMDDRQVGRLYKAVRIKLNLRQVDVSAKAGVGQGDISALELGRLEVVGLTKARRVANVLGVRLSITAHWQGGDGDRLLDRAHASIVEYVVRALREAHWDVIPEFTFNVYGDRGSVDILAWHPGERILLIIEVKATLTDLQAMLASLSKKRRVVPGAVGKSLPWRPQRIAVLLVVAGTSANRAAVARHAATFDVAFPTRSRAVREWLRRPVGSIAGLWFTTGEGSSIASVSRSRVRCRRRASCHT